MNHEELRERLAEYAHEAWSNWMRWMFETGGRVEEDDVWVMHRALYDRWQRQMRTKYADLPESEKKSDRIEADRMLAIMEKK